MEEKNLAENNFNHNYPDSPVVRYRALFVRHFRRLKFRLLEKFSKLNKRRLLYWGFGATITMMVVGFVGMVFLFAYFAKDLPSPTKVARVEGFSSRIYDRNGKVIYDLYKDVKMEPVAWEEVPENLKKATISVEDKDFYKHKGFDPLAPFRIAKNVLYNHRLIGGSTLTQQLVKNVLLTSERSLDRKIKEFILAVQIETKYDKDEILLMYLNEAPYGGAMKGVKMASEMYFGKQVKDLTLTESVILAGLPQRPSAYSPFSRTPTAYVDRTAHVLERMVEDGIIDDNTQKRVLSEAKAYKFNENRNVNISPHFVFWLKDQLIEKYGEDEVEAGGLKVTSTLDLELQQEVEKIVAEEIDKAEKLGVSNGAVIVMDPKTGEVLAMVGSREYDSDKTDGKFNVVTSGLRQPGSAIKPVTYLMGLRKGFTASSMIIDAPVTFPGTAGQKDYNPQNYNGKFYGPMSLRNALGNSINTTAVKMLAKVGVENMLRQAFDMGMTTLEPTPENMRRFGLAVTLGGAEVKMIELASAYSSFANGGTKVEPVGIWRLEDRHGRLVEENGKVEGKRVMTPQEAYIISNILSDNSARELTFGAQNGLIIPNYQVAVKTGTTNDKRDNWAIGWTPNLLVTAWVGNNDNSPMLKIASGVSGATPIWRRVMQFALPRRNKQDFPIPERMVNMEVDRVSGYAAHDGFASKSEYFIEGTQPTVVDPIHMNLKVCRGDQKGLATPEDVANNNYDQREFIKLREEDPVSKDGKNRWQEGVDNWVSQQGDRDKYNPPENYCRSGGMIKMNFESPGNQSTVGNDIDIRIGSTSLKKVVEVKLWVDGREEKTWTEKPYELRLNLADGKHALKVKGTDKDGNSHEEEIKIGVNVPWDYEPTPTSVATPTTSLFTSPTPVVTGTQ